MLDSKTIFKVDIEKPSPLMHVQEILHYKRCSMSNCMAFSKWWLLTKVYKSAFVPYNSCRQMKFSTTKGLHQCYHPWQKYFKRKKPPPPYFSFGDRTENIIHTYFATTACWLMTFLDIVLLKDLYMSVEKLIEDTYHYFFSCTKSEMF